MSATEAQVIEALFVSMAANYTKGVTAAKPQWQKIATLVPSTGAANFYGGLKDLPGIKEWVGTRQLATIDKFGYTIQNKTWESSITIGREEVDDDQIGMYGVISQKYGEDVAMFPDSLAYGLLAKGFTDLCLDGQPYFDVDHPLGDGVKVYSNVVGTPSTDTGSPWFLLDENQVLKPIVFQERRKFKFENMNPSGEFAWFNNKFVAGTDGRCNVGFGFPQTAIGSKAALTEANYEAAIKMLGEMKKANGTPSGVRPTTLVVGYENRAAAKKLIERMVNDAGASNIYYKDVEVVVSPYIVKP